MQSKWKIRTLLAMTLLFTFGFGLLAFDAVQTNGIEIDEFGLLIMGSAVMVGLVVWTVYEIQIWEVLGNV